MNNGKIIAVDFDGTITEPSPFPITGALRKEAVKYLTLLHAKGYDLVLWCARKGTDYDDAVKLVRQWELPIRIPEPQVGKIFAHFYIDDHSYMGKLNWKKIYKYIIKHIK